MRTRIYWVSLLLSAVGYVSAQSQGGLGGVVTDDNGEPVIGAQVVVKGTQTGAVTDISGKFILPPGVKRGASLTVSYVGMESQQLKAASDMKIKLHSDDKELDEVIVVAYGEQKRSSFTGSAGVVSADKIAQRQTNTVVDALEGQVAGVQMYKSGGDPTATPSILVRGISSINAGQEPLIVVDGSPYYGAWSDINPADVASITVLKDAASNALYGARGANGVIMITTKSAKQGRTTVSLDAKWGSVSRASKTYDMITEPGQYYELQYKALYNKYISDGRTSAAAHAAANTNMLGDDASAGGLGYNVYNVPEGQYLIGDNGRLNPNATLGRVVSYNGQDYTLRPDDWLKAAYRTALRQEYNVNINGGNEASQFYASLGYLDNPGISYGSEYKRYTARVKANYKASEWLKVGTNVNYAHSVVDYSSDGTSDSGNNIFYALTKIAPIYPLYLRDGQGNIMTDSNGKMMDYGDGTNAGCSRYVLNSQNQLKDDQLQTKNQVGNTFNINGFVDITPTFLKGLKLTVNGTVNTYEYRYTSTVQPFYGTSHNTYPEGYISKSHYRYYTVNFQQLLNYSRSFGLHTMTLLLGHENYRQTSEDIIATRTQMFSYFGNQELSGAIKNEYGNSDQSKYNTEGYFFRGMYDYDNKYFAQLSYRRDGSSRFSPKSRWGNFYSFGAAWIISKESWMQPSNSWLQELKLKMSFGQQGNDAIGSSKYLDTYIITNSSNNVALMLATKGNENITWETNSNFNIGAEFSMLDSRLRGSLEYFYRKTTNMLSTIIKPMSQGTGVYYANVGNMVNRGVELDLSGDVIKSKDFVWSLNLNVTHYRNEITKIYEDNKKAVLDGHNGYTSGNYFYGEGLSIYTWRLPKYAGVDNEGNSMWYKTEANGNITTTTNYEDVSYYACGDPTPDIYGGFGTSLSYKGFDFNINFSFSLGGKVFDYGYQSLMHSPNAQLAGQNFHKDVLNAWSKDNADSNIPRFQFGDIYQNATSDRFLISGSYLSLNGVNLGYSLPRNLIGKWGLSKLRVYVSADNVNLWSKRKGLDPRTSYAGSPGTENYSFSRTISGGVTLSF